MSSPDQMGHTLNEFPPAPVVYPARLTFLKYGEARSSWWPGLLPAVFLMLAFPARAQVQAISGILTSNLTYNSTNDNYATIGGGSAGFPTGTVYNVRFNEGTTNIMRLAGVTMGGRTFDFAWLAKKINIVRSTNAAVTGALHIVLYEQSAYSGTNILLKSSYAATMEESLLSRVINQGADNVFANQGDSNGNNNNIERIDYIFPDGFPAYDHIDQRGFLVMDRGGNDRFKIAAITALDANGMPAAFKTPVSVMETNWGASGVSLDTIVMRGYTAVGDRQHPSADVDPQALSGVFLSWQTLGVQSNESIYGYSLAANDSPTNAAYWTNVQNSAYFPTNTSPDATYGGLDLISGGAIFFDSALNVTLGDRAWEDLNMNGIQDAGEPGISNVLVHVYDGNTNLMATARTDENGAWLSAGHSPGTFFIKYFCPAGYEFTGRHSGTNTTADSDADPVTGQTAAFVMSGDQTNRTLDAGFFRRAGVGDFTWEDMNGNGQQDGGEPALSNVVVTLYNVVSNVIGTTTSSVAGAYAFTNLVPGSYFVSFTPPAGYLFTTSNEGNDATDSDPLPGTNRTAAIALISGEANATADAGFYRPASLGDYTWVDTNGNGQQDGGEPALSNVVVTLYNSAANMIGTTVSSVAGAYAFTNLVPGSYFVSFTPPAGYLFTTSNEGNDATDSDPLPGTNRTAAIALISGEANATADAGFYRPASLGDYTWVDANGNGQQDGGEPALSNVVVTLYNVVSNVIGTTTSSVAGAYAFTNLAPGSYFVAFVPPAGYLFTSSNVGNDLTDSDPLPGTNRTALVVLTNGQADITVDAGFCRPASLGDYTWVDSNYNGQQDGGEPALSNVVITLYNAASSLVGTTTSSVTGGYAFTNLVPGSYFMGFTPPAGYLFTTSNVGVDATDSDPLAGTGLTALYTLTSGQADATVDAGFYNPADVSLKLIKSTSLSTNWNLGATNEYYLTLANTSGVALTGVKLTDVLPAGVAFVAGSAQIVQLVTVTTNPVVETVSDGFGTASYANNDGTANWVGSWNEVGDDGSATTGSELVRVAGGTNALVFENAAASNDHVTRTNALTPRAGRTYTNMSLSFAYRREAWDAGDTFTFYVSTNGFASQSNLVFAVPTVAGTDATYVQVATNLTAQMGASVTLRLRAGATFGAGDRINFDFLTFTNAGYDISTNIVSAYNSNVTVTVVSNLAAATPANLLANYTLPGGSSVTVRIRATLDVPLVSTQFINTAVATNPTTPPLNASVTNTAMANSVGDWAWLDANANGIQDGAETGLTGVTVRIYTGASNLLATTTTGADGAYSFTNLPTGSYFLEFAAAGYHATLQDQGGNDPLDSDIDGAGRTATFSLSGGTNDTSRDAGFYQLAALGDYTWMDVNFNGQQDGGEPSLSNVVVTLCNAASNVIGITISSVAGAYTFTNLVPGSYFVGFAPPAGYLFTTSNAGDDAMDSDALAGTNRTAVIVLASGQNDLTVDAGFYRPASLGDYTWVDSNYNGQQDGGEPALSNVVVTLYNAASNAIGMTTSSVAGAYAFTNLPPGSYFVGFAPPAGYLFTTSNVGADATDSDALAGTNRTALVALTNGQNDLTVDAGFYRPASLGDYTWVDSNYNGQQGGGEPALSNVVITLYNAASNLVGTTTSSVAGAYSFTNLPPGGYFVRFAPPAGYLFTTSNVGADTTDSDASPTTGSTGGNTLTNGQADITVDAGFYNPADVSMKLFKSTSLSTNWNFGVTNDYYLTIQNTGTVSLTGVALTDVLPPGATLVNGNAAIVQLLAIATNPFTETVADTFGTAAYGNNDGTTNWSGGWIEVGDDGSATTGSELVRTAGGTNALVFELTNADNDHVTRTNRLSAVPGRVYTNSVLSFSYRREAWDANDSMTFYISTNGFASQSNLVYTIDSRVGTDAAYSNVTTNITAFMGTNLALRVRAGPNFAAGDRINFDFITITHTGYEVSTNAVLSYSNGVTINVVSNLATATATNLLENYSLPGGASVTVRIRATLDVPLVSTQFINTATATNALTPPATACVTNFSVANAVGDRVWLDANANGIQDDGTTGVAGVTVQLYSAASNLLAATTTGAGGTYSFTNLPSGAYFLQFAAAGYVATRRDQGGNDTEDSDIDDIGRTAIFDLSGGTNDLSRDAGGYQLTGVGNFTWADQNGNGQQDAGEPGLSNVVVTLFNALSNVVGVTTSGVAGIYGFANLPPGTYRMSFAGPSGYQLTTANVGADTTDSDPLAGTNRTADFVLISGASDESVDAGFFRPAVLGDYTWYDQDADGQQDVDEPPLAGVGITLYRDISNIVGVATSSTAGGYAFSNLVPGDYRLEFSAPTGYQLTLANTGDDGTDSDPIPATHQTTSVTLAGGETNRTVDGGFYRLARISGRIWYDEDRDGLQDTFETNVLTAVAVDLLDTNGTLVASTTSDGLGCYRFYVDAGSYLIRYNLTEFASYLLISPANVGEDDSLDSDALYGNVGNYSWTAPLAASINQEVQDVDLGIRTPNPTRAVLATAWGEWREHQAWIMWRTESEYNTAGFFVYRIDPETGRETRLTPVLQPSTFREDGATYGMIDPLANENSSGRYRLEELELTGERCNLGEREIRFNPAAPGKTVRAASRLTKLPEVRTAAIRKVDGRTSAVLKVRVPQEGIYAVDLRDIAAGMGRPAEEIQALAAGGSLRLTCQGAPVPVIYDGALGRLIFHGETPAASWYVHDSVYLISIGAGLVMERREPGATGGAEIGPVSIHFEKNLFLFSMTHMPQDFYFWAGVVSGYGELSVQNFPLDLSGYAGGDLNLKVRLMGWSSSTNKPDHLAKFRFNGEEMGAVAFDDQDAVEVVLNIPAAAVQDGLNNLTVEGVLQPGRSESFFVVDWINATFERRVQPMSGTTHFRAGGAGAISAAAFERPLALALDESGHPTWIADNQGELPAKAWTTTSGNERFAVVDSRAAPVLVPEPAAADAWFLAATNRIDYLVVAPRALSAVAQVLADYRADQGLRTGVAVFEDVCDLMAGGVRTPAAVPALLRHAASTWAEPPTMVVLAGNGNYDYLGIQGCESNQIPPLLVQTPSGVCASDGLMADTGGDPRPDLAIGRLPARNECELNAMIEKIKAYERNPEADWLSTVFMAADKADTLGSFKEENERLASLVKAPRPVPQCIDLDNVPIVTARSRFQDWFRTGAGFIHYTGHGGMKNLGVQNLLSGSDIDVLAGGSRPPVLVTLTCLAARYEVPDTDSLGELLMQCTRGGAVAILGSSGLSQNMPAGKLADALYHAIFQDGTGRLGLAFLKARRSQAEDLFSKDTYAVYNLLGDPALRVAGNDVTNSQSVAARITLSELNQVFDGNPHAAIATTAPAGLAVRLTYNGSSLPPVAAGTYVVTATVVTATYEATTVDTLVVAKAAASITLHNLSQIYAGGPRTVTATTVPDGLPVWLAYDGAGEAPVAAGTYGVTATIADTNYAGAASGVLEVVKAPAFINLAGLVQTYDGNAKTVAVNTQPAGLAVEIRYDELATPPVAAGDHAVTAQVVDSNYQGAVTARMDILRANAEVVLGSLEQTYDGQPRPATAMTQPMELAVDFTYNGAAAAPVSAGRYEVRGTVSDPNWQGSDSGWLVIGKGNQTIQFADIGNAAPGEVLALSATASSGLPVNFEWIRGPATLDSSGTVLRLTGEGEVEVRASQAGDANWNAAPRVPQIIRVAYPPPRLELSKGTVLVHEAGEGRLFVRLASAPKSNTVVAISRSAGSEGIVVRSGAIRTFTPADWNVWQPVTLAAAEDNNAISETAVIQMTVTGGESWLVDAVAMDDDLGSNLALASSGTAIKGAGANQLAQMIDGNHLSSTNYGWTVWTNPAVPGTATLDLKTTATVSRVRILNWDWVYRVHRYRLDGSVDGNTWFPVEDASGEDHQGWDEWPVGQTPFRYLRFTGLSNSVNQCVVISELEIYGIRPDAGAVLPQPVLSKDVVKIREGSTGRFFLHLDQAPASPAVFHVTLQSGDAGISLQGGAALTFTPANWSEWQGVTLAAAEDENRIGETAVYRISATGYADRIVSAVALDDDDGRNLALATSGATAKGLRASQAGALIDGIYNVSTNYGWTVWTNLAQPGTLTIDLKDTTTVSRIRLLNWDWVYRVNRYQIETSPNGTDWTMWADASADGHHGWEEWPAPERLARYVKFTGISNSANQCVVISELEVYGALPVFSQTAVNVREGGEGRFFMRMDSAPSAPVSFGISVDSTASGVQVQGGAVLKFTAQNWSEWQAVTLAAAEDTNRTDELATIRISAPGYAARYVTATVLDNDIGVNLALAANGTVVKGTRASQAAALIDGVHDVSTNYGWTVWTNLALPGTITLDLKTTATVSRIRLLNWDWVYRVHRYRIESSVDGLNWRTLADASRDDHHGWDDWPVADLGMRYVRFTGLSNSVNQCVLISELEVYGADAGRRMAGVKSKTAGPDSARVQDIQPYPVTVVTSEDAGPEHTNGWVVVDGDPNTGWAGKPGTGGWIAIGYNTTVAMTNLVVELEADASVQIRGLFSMDGNNWEELPEVANGLPVEFNYLWLFFTANGQAGLAPRIMEIRPEE